MTQWKYVYYQKEESLVMLNLMSETRNKHIYSKTYIYILINVWNKYMINLNFYASILNDIQYVCLLGRIAL